MDRVRLALTYRRLRRHLVPGRTDVLEIGFGGGALLRRIEAEGAVVSGVDADRLEKSGGWSPREGRVWIGTVEEVELPEASFDLVFGIHVIEHLTDPSVVFAKCFRALRPGGKVFWITPNARSVGLRLFGAHWWNFEDPTHTRFYTPESATRMLEGAGFEEVGAARLPLDSLAMEPSSLARTLVDGDPEHGVMASPLVPLLAAVALPLTMVARLALPGLAPSMEVWGRKPLGAVGSG